MNEEGIAALLGLVLLSVGGVVEINYEDVQAGLPENSFVRVEQDDMREVLIIKVVQQ